MKRMLKYLKPYSGMLVLSMVAIAVATVGELLLPSIMSRILDEGIKNKDFSYIVICSLQMFAIALVSFGAWILGSYAGARIIAGFSTDLKDAVFKKVNTLTFEEMNSVGSSSLISRSIYDVGTVSWVATMLAETAVTVPILFIGGVVLSMRKDVTLSLLMLTVIPVVFGAVVLIARKVEPLWETADKYIDKQNDILRERLHGIRVIRAFNNEPKEQEKAANATRIMADKIIKGNVTMGILSPLAIMLLNVAVVFIVWLGGFRIGNGQGNATGADIFAVIQYMALVMNGVMIAAMTIVMLPEANVSIKRIFHVIDLKGIPNGEKDSDFRLSGDLELKNVTFYYEKSEKPAVEDVSLKISEGQKIAIIGGTGSGKSTIVRLLMKFYKPTEGAICSGGTDLATIEDKAVRNEIGCALQKAAIYTGTVKENILMGAECDEEKLAGAVRIAQLDEFIAGLPDGIDHILEQSGKNISGGQKQRICIARAIYKDAPLYIFDDTFSALDFITEAKLRRALAEEKKDKTVIVITQRITSAMNSDVIFVMDQGKLIDSGKHDELLARCNIYKEIYMSQTGGVSA
ncbi:MAG: ABC transporter ATP-binding protein [Clostridia bacterium]|nr:ABC transporter ATP-binding protein [Clostridia bacterium]